MAVAQPQQPLLVLLNLNICPGGCSLVLIPWCLFPCAPKQTKPNLECMFNASLKTY